MNRDEWRDSWEEVLRGHGSSPFGDFDFDLDHHPILGDKIQRTPSPTRPITFETLDELMWRLTND